MNPNLEKLLERVCDGNVGFDTTVKVLVLVEIMRAIDRNTEAIELLARATAGEFEAEDGPVPRSLGER